MHKRVVIDLEEVRLGLVVPTLTLQLLATIAGAHIVSSRPGFLSIALPHPLSELTITLVDIRVRVVSVDDAARKAYEQLGLDVPAYLLSEARVDE